MFHALSDQQLNTSVFVSHDPKIGFHLLILKVISSFQFSCMLRIPKFLQHLSPPSLIFIMLGYPYAANPVRKTNLLEKQHLSS